jgi:hypothetical protein
MTLLDRAHSLARIDALDLDAYRAELDAVGDDFDAPYADALVQIDALASRAMRFLIDDVGLAPPTRNVFASTIAMYADRLELLAQRVHSAAPHAVDAVLAAATRALALRDVLREIVLALVATRATDAIPVADRKARDRDLDERARRRWSAMRRDREALVAHPALIATPLDKRLAALPDQLDEPEPEPEKSFADMIEMD